MAATPRLDPFRPVIDEIQVEAGHAPVEVFVRQSHRPGAEAEADFGEVTVRLRRELVT